MSRKDEILEVKKLGERIGYGNLMDIASALMSIKSDGIEIEHVPTVLPCMAAYRLLKSMVLLLWG